MACGKNGRVPYGQKGVDDRSQWRTGTRETEVRLDGWCEGGLRQHRNDSGGEIRPDHPSGLTSVSLVPVSH